MTRYAVSWIGWHDNDLHTQFVEAESELAALQAKLIALNCVVEEMPATIEDCKQCAFDCDHMIHAAEVPHD